MRSSPKTAKEKVLLEGDTGMAGNSMAVSSVQCYRPKLEQGAGELIGTDEFDSILSFENLNDDHHQEAPVDDDHDQKKNNPPLSFLEKWLLDETAAQGEEMIDQLSPIF